MRAQGVLFWGALALLVLPAAVVTALRLLGPDSAHAVQLVSFAPLALPAYAAALVLLAVAVLRRPAARAPLLVVALVPVLAGLGLHAWWLAPLVAGERPATDGRTWSVLTSNLLAGQGDGLAVLRTALAEDVDVLVLQEVTPWTAPGWPRPTRTGSARRCPRAAPTARWCSPARRWGSRSGYGPTCSRGRWR